MKKGLLIIPIIIILFVACQGRKNTTVDEPVRIGIAWRADTLSEFYTNVVRAIEEAGAEPVLLPQVRMNDFAYIDSTLAPTYTDENGVLLQQYADMVKQGYTNSNVSTSIRGVDAVVFTGGEDIAPSLLLQPEPWHGIEAEKDYNATRDISDYLTMMYCLDKDMPLMGFCRGMQMLVVVSGGTIIQDIPTYFAQQGKPYCNEHRNPSEPDTYRDYAPHDVNVIDTASWLYRIVGSSTVHGAPSWHHQAAGSVAGTSLRVTGTTPTGGIDIIEAVQRTDKSFAVGLQYHPEAALVKRLDHDENANDFMSYDEAVAYFKEFIHQARTRTKTQK
jgi:putative glutamine amidotransferase